MSKSLLKEPENSQTPRVFVAATRQNDGKTTTCLGLYAALQQKVANVGYIKPIGQRFIELLGHKIDEDSYLFDRTYPVGVPVESMSPIAIDSSFTRRFIDDSEKMLPILVDRMLRAFDRGAYGKDLMIIEGSGHAGVGAICELSNAQVARHLNAKAIIVSRGGIGKPVDEIALNKSLFDQHGVEVIGAIINKVLPEKIEIVERYTRKALDRMGVPLLGIIPTANILANPNLAQVGETLGARWLNARRHGEFNRITKVVVGAMTAKGLVDAMEPGVLILTPGDRDDILLLAIAGAGISSHNVPAGIILTRNILPSPHIMEMLSKTNIPTMICTEDSYRVASKIDSMTVKTLPEDMDKIPVIKKIVQENVDVDPILDRLST